MKGAYAQICLIKRTRRAASQQPLDLIHIIPITQTHRPRPNRGRGRRQLLPPALRRQRPRNAAVHAARKRAQPLVEDAERDDREERQDEGEVRADMPSGEDDAGVDDLGVPVLKEAAGRRRSALHDGLAFQEPERGMAYQSICIEHIPPMSIPSCPP